MLLAKVLAYLGYFEFFARYQPLPYINLASFLLLVVAAAAQASLFASDPGISSLRQQQLPHPLPVHAALSRYCSVCKIVRSRAVEHCIYCDVCIDEYDHHCDVVGKCISQKNSSLMQFYSAVTMGYIVALGVAVAGVVLVQVFGVSFQGLVDHAVNR